MAPITNVTILTTATSILTAAAGRGFSGPLYLKNESNEIITLTIAGADTYALDPGEVYPIIPGQVVTGTSIGGAAKLQIIQGVKPADESASKGGGSVAAAGSAAVSGHQGIWSVGQEDFTAVRASDTTLTLGTFPTGMGTPDDEKFIMAVVTPLVGEQVVYLATQYKHSLVGQVLTVAGAVFAADDVAYDVFAWGPPKSYDASTNAGQVVPITLPRPPQDSPQKSASSLGDGTTHKYFDVERGKDATLRILDTPGGAGDNSYTIWTSQLNDGTAEGSADFQDRTDEFSPYEDITTAIIAAKASDGVLQLNGIQAKRIRVTNVRANDGGGTDGAYQYDIMWS